MAELSTLARPYAKAAFDYASEQEVVNEWEQCLIVASAVVDDNLFKTLLDNPAISASQKASALVSICQEQLAQAQINQEVWGAFSNFIMQLAEQERLILMPEVLVHFRHYKSKASKQVDAYVTSAYPLTETQRVLIQSRLASSLNASVVLHESVDPSLLAGATIKIGDKIVDDSVRGKLKQLKSQLTA